MIARLRFDGGKCTSLEVIRKGKVGGSYTESTDVSALVSSGLLSLTDRMILNQIAARVEAMAAKLSEG